MILYFVRDHWQLIRKRIGCWRLSWSTYYCTVYCQKNAAGVPFSLSIGTPKKNFSSLSFPIGKFRFWNSLNNSTKDRNSLLSNIYTGGWFACFFLHSMRQWPIVLWWCTDKAKNLETLLKRIKNDSLNGFSSLFVSSKPRNPQKQLKISYHTDFYRNINT